MKAAALKPERLDKVLAKLLNISRAQAASLVKAGRIRVNEDEEPGLKAADKVAPDDLLYLDDELIEAAGAAELKRVLMFNKPLGCVCADKDKRWPTVLNYLTDVPRREELHCAGRLDRDACGLLIVTDDGALNHEITAPRRQIAKTYLVGTKEPIPERAAEAFARGVKHPEENERYQSAELRVLEPCKALVRVTEGRFHEVKRLFETVGCEVSSLERLSIGALLLDPKLPRGKFRQLAAEETALLFADPLPLTQLAAQCQLTAE